LVSQGQFTVFQLIDSCLGGKFEQTQQIFETLIADESLMILITWMLAKELRLLVELSLAMATGETLANLSRQHRLWPAKVALYQPLLKRYSQQQLWALLSRLAIIDKANKGLGTLSARSQLQHLLQMIASRQYLLMS
jgi:DNA polymerase-3 subunit delta